MTDRNRTCPVCGDTLTPKPCGNLACVCGFVAMSRLQVERIYQTIDRASRLAASGARLDAVRNGDLPGARVCACGKNADGASVLVGYIPATAKED